VVLYIYKYFVVAFHSDQLIVVAGCGAKKVWVFSVSEEAGGGSGQGALLGLINRLTRPATARRTRIKLAKFIASNDGISHLSLHSGGWYSHRQGIIAIFIAYHHHLSSIAIGR
jgi:hypothetical protein